jgi:hypothetical protein
MKKIIALLLISLSTLSYAKYVTKEVKKEVISSYRITFDTSDMRWGFVDKFVKVLVDGDAVGALNYGVIGRKEILAKVEVLKKSLENKKVKINKEKTGVITSFSSVSDEVCSRDF